MLHFSDMPFSFLGCWQSASASNAITLISLITDMPTRVKVAKYYWTHQLSISTEKARVNTILTQTPGNCICSNITQAAFVPIMPHVPDCRHWKSTRQNATQITIYLEQIGGINNERIP